MPNRQVSYDISDRGEGDYQSSDVSESWRSDILSWKRSCHQKSRTYYVVAKTDFGIKDLDTSQAAKGQLPLLKATSWQGS